jgi:Na+/H+ antiporter NhaC
MCQLAILVCFFDLRNAYVPLSFFLLVGFLTLYRSGLSGTILMFLPMAAHLEKQTDPEKERYECLRFFVSSTLAVVW